MGEVRWTREAENWLRKIHDYIAQDKPEAALRTVQGIYEKTQILAKRAMRFGRSRAFSGEELEVVPVHWFDLGEVSSISCRDGGQPQSFGYRDHGGVDKTDVAVKSEEILRAREI